MHCPSDVYGPAGCSRLAFSGTRGDLTLLSNTKGSRLSRWASKPSNQPARHLSPETGQVTMKEAKRSKWVIHSFTWIGIAPWIVGEPRNDDIETGGVRPRKNKHADWLVSIRPSHLKRETFDKHGEESQEEEKERGGNKTWHPEKSQPSAVATLQYDGICTLI